MAARVESWHPNTRIGVLYFMKHTRRYICTLRVSVVHANTCQDPVCPCRVAMRVHACQNEVIIELYRMTQSILHVYAYCCSCSSLCYGVYVMHYIIAGSASKIRRTAPVISHQGSHGQHHISSSSHQFVLLQRIN